MRTRTNKAYPANKQTVRRLVEAQIGKGRLVWCPLPIELNERIEPLRELYRYALQSAGVTIELEWLRGGDLPGIYGRKLCFAQGSLFIFVSEYGHPAEVEVKDPKTNIGYAFTLESERSVLFAVNRNGDVRAVYRPNEVHIQVKAKSRE